MRSKIFPLLILLMISVSGFLLFRILSLPEIPRDLLANQDSYYQIVNEDKTRIIFFINERFATVRSRQQKIVKVLDAARKTVDLLQKSNQQLDSALAFRNVRDSVYKFLNRASFYQNEMLVFQEEFTEEKIRPIARLDTISALPEALISLAITKARNDILAINQHVMERYAWNTDAGTIAFDYKYGGLLEKSNSPEWIQGIIAFNPPVEMKLNQKDRIQVRISKKFLSSMVETMSRTESVNVDSLMVSDIMIVKLSGDEFKIVDHDEEEQGVTDDGYSQWEFDVTPQKSGDHELFLKVGMVYFVPNLGPAKKYFPVYEKKIKVTVSAWQVVAGFATERWEFIVSSIVIPIGVWFVSRVRSRKKGRAGEKVKE